MQYTDHNWFMLQEMRALVDIKWRRALRRIGASLDQAESHVAFLSPSGTAR